MFPPFVRQKITMPVCVIVYVFVFDRVWIKFRNYEKNGEKCKEGRGA